MLSCIVLFLATNEDAVVVCTYPSCKRIKTHDFLFGVEVRKAVVSKTTAVH